MSGGPLRLAQRWRATPWLRISAYLVALGAWWWLVRRAPYLLETSIGERGSARLSGKLLEHYQSDGARIAIQGFALIGVFAVALELWIARGWSLKRHWFTPTPLRDLALARIVVVGIQLAFYLYPYPASHTNLPEAVWVTEIDPRLYDPSLGFEAVVRLLGLAEPPGLTFVEGVWTVGLVAGALAWVGLLTRPCLLMFGATTSFLVAHAYSFGEGHHPEALMCIALWALGLAPSGRALSLDSLLLRWWKSEQPLASSLDEFALWPMRLVQWLLAITYLDAGLAKLENGGLSWMNGYTLSFIMGADGRRYGRPIGVLLSESPSLLVVPSVVVILLEIGFILILLTRWSWVLAPLGIALHLGIFLAQGPPFFQNIALYICFLERFRPGHSNFSECWAWLRGRRSAVSGGKHLPFGAAERAGERGDQGQVQKQDRRQLPEVGNADEHDAV